MVGVIRLLRDLVVLELRQRPGLVCDLGYADIIFLGCGEEDRGALGREFLVLRYLRV